MAGTLVLNATYEPLGVVAVRRALVLVLGGKASTVESEATWHSADDEYPAPSVIRLNRFVRVPYRPQAPYSRRGVLIRDRHTCAYCGKRAQTVDHVVPKSRGGEATSYLNTVAACHRCNGVKGSKTLAEMGWSLPFTPYAPGHALLAEGPPRPAWQPYLQGWPVGAAAAAP